VQNSEQEYDQFLDELRDYSRYLYEEELNRSERFHGAMKTYLLFIGSTLAGSVATIKWLNLSPLMIKRPSLSFFELLLNIGLLTALLLLIAAFTFAVLVIKGWKTERLCEPKEFILTSSMIGKKTKLLESIISNYAIAAERNGKVNDKRSTFLFLASGFYRIGLVLILICGILFIFI